MDIKELLWLTHGMELKDAIDAIADSEWDSYEQFYDIVDISTSTLHSAILTDDTFNEYSDEAIQQAIYDAICDYIEVDCFKHS